MKRHKKQNIKNSVFTIHCVNVCPRYNLWCPFWDNFRNHCRADEAYGALLTHYWPRVKVMPWGKDSIPVSEELTKVLCKHMRKYMSDPELISETVVDNLLE